MANTDINVYRISGSPELYEPSRDNAFRFVVSNQLDKLLPVDLNLYTATDDDYLTGCQNLLEIATTSASVPHFSLEEVSISRGNTTVYYASKPTFDTCSVKFDDFVGANVKDALFAWRALAYDVNTGTVNTADKYKVDCSLIEYSSDFSRVIRTWTLHGCWLKDISENEFSHDSAGKRQITGTIRYDYATVERSE